LSTIEKLDKMVKRSFKDLQVEFVRRLGWQVNLMEGFLLQKKLELFSTMTKSPDLIEDNFPSSKLLSKPDLQRDRSASRIKSLNLFWKFERMYMNFELIASVGKVIGCAVA